MLNQVPSKAVPRTPYELWLGKRPSLHHPHVWGCKAEVGPYNPQSKKLDSKIVSGFFIGYCVGSRGSRFYCPSHTTRLIELDRAIYFKDDDSVGTSQGPREIVFRENCFLVLIHVVSTLVSGLMIDLAPEQTHGEISGEIVP